MIRQFGTTSSCYHNPPVAFGSPNGVFPMADGNFLVTDDHNDRVIVVDPRTNQIVWQYGHSGMPGSAPGYLSNPDGVDLAPPYSLLMTHADSMGHP